MQNIKIGDQVTVTVRGQSRIAGLLRSIDGDKVQVATRLGIFTRTLAEMQPMDDGYSLNTNALAAINAAN